MDKKMGTILYFLLACWIAAGIWLFVEFLSYYRGLGWDDRKKSEQTALYDSNVTYKR